MKAAAQHAAFQVCYLSIQCTCAKGFLAEIVCICFCVLVWTEPKHLYENRVIKGIALIKSFFDREMISSGAFHLPFSPVLYLFVSL